MVSNDMPAQQSMTDPDWRNPRGLLKGVFAAVVVGFAARFLSDHYGAPAMLMALLLGIAFHFLHEETSCRKGIDFASGTILRVGVALLGLRVSWQMLADLGLTSVVWVIIGVIVTMLCGLALAKLLRRDWKLGVLTGGSVAICGASAAMAISAILPKTDESETNLTFTVMGVTVLSTLAMIIYPIVVSAMGMTPDQAGLFLGATIHDVAQVVGAGYTVSVETGEISTIVKLLRVATLAPVIFVIALVLGLSKRHISSGPRPALLPAFVVGFLVLATLNSLIALPQQAHEMAGAAASWMLLIAVAAVGMKTSLNNLTQMGSSAVLLIVSETVFLAIGFVLLIHFTR